MYEITLKTKNLKSLKNYLHFLNKLSNRIYIKNNYFLTSTKTKTKLFTILKSPHINKTARVQLGYKTYTKKIKFKTTKKELIIYLLKETSKNTHFDVSFKISLYKIYIFYIYE